VVERQGLLVTSVAATAVAMARILSFPGAVAMMDKAIHIPRQAHPWPRGTSWRPHCPPSRRSGE
jgi:hypothetical protein